jgi:two-component system, LytTR family, response regulator
MTRCIVIDDEPYARQLLTEFIAKIPNLKLEGAFSSALNALPLLTKKPIDVIFLDIQMPDISGIDFLKTLDKRPAVVLTTAFAEYALEGFELDVADYLLKPFDFGRFLKAINKITKSSDIEHIVKNESVRGSSQEFIFVKDGTKLVKVDLKEILYIQGSREYVTIHTRDKKIMSLQAMKNLEEELPDHFIRVHNSYIINIPTVTSISKQEVEIGDDVIPIGITYKKNFHEKIRKYFPGREIRD